MDGLRARGRLRRALVGTAAAGLLVATGFVAAADAAPSGPNTNWPRPHFGTSANAATSTPRPSFGKLTPRLAQLAAAGQPTSPANKLPRSSNIPDNHPGGLRRVVAGQVVVDVRVTDTGAATQAAIARAGARVLAVSQPAMRTITVTAPDPALTALSNVAQVQGVREVLTPKTNACAPIVSEGDSVHQAAKARTDFTVTGAGQTVGILSDSFNHLGGQPADVTGGELPGPGNPCGFTTPVNVAADGSGGSDEGRAMAQTVHSLAPGAPLAFETGGVSQTSMANNITDLRTTQGAKVIVDDITYFDEPFYQDGPISVAVNNARGAGVPYFSSAGNSTVLVNGQDVTSYEALQYRGTPCFTNYLDCHNFDTSGVAGNAFPLDGAKVPPKGTITVDLQWAQPQGGVTTDYDLFLLDSAGNALTFSTNNNATTQEPFEFISWTNPDQVNQATVFLVVARFAGPPVRFKFTHLGSNLDDVQFTTTTSSDIIGGGSIFGHNGAANTFSVGAANWNTPFTPEGYSSRGPVTLLFQPVPSTAALGPQVLSKPDLTAVDCVQNSFFPPGSLSPHRFCGTSDAAPHAAAIAALMLEKKPTMTPAQVGQMMAQQSTVLPFSSNVVGAGLLNVDASIRAMVDDRGQYNASLIYLGAPHVFYWDSTSNSLRHDWWTGFAWGHETLDGPGSAGVNGQTLDSVGQYVSATLYNGGPQVWYYDSTAQSLRHGWWTGTIWAFETLDGTGSPGGSGRTTHPVGQFTSVLLYNGGPQVWYYDSTDHSLRHGWWTGSLWAFEILDGTGSPGGNGRTTEQVGQSTSVLLYNGGPQVWYYDSTVQSLRHGWWTGALWAFETLDGTGSPVGFGRTNDNVGQFTSVLLYNGGPQVWYYDSTSPSLRHGWWTGALWAFETLDGAGSPGGSGRSTDQVGQFTSVLLYNGGPQVWYYDSVVPGNQRHGWWSGAAWSFETLDGFPAGP